MFRRFKNIKSLKDFFGVIMFDYCPKCMSEKFWLEAIYLKWTGLHLDLKHPKTFNEKIQWMKLYDRNPLYTQLVDKNLVKEWVADKIGKQYVIPTLAVYSSEEEIDFDKLPNQFVLKCNHDSGSVIVCRNKEQIDKDEVKRHFRERLAYDCSAVCGEWAYRNVPRMIIAEQFMEDKSGEALMDYKWFCFNGIPKIMYMCRDKGEHPTTDFFDMEFNRLPIRIQDPPSEVCPDKPVLFDEMKRLAGVLSKGLPEVRVDFYVVNGQIYFGEMTFYHLGGMTQIKPYEWNVKMGEMIHLPDNL